MPKWKQEFDTKREGKMKKIRNVCLKCTAEQDNRQDKEINHLQYHFMLHFFLKRQSMAGSL